MAEEVNRERTKKKDEMRQLSDSLRESMGSDLAAIEDLTKGIDEKTAFYKVRVLKR